MNNEAKTLEEYKQKVEICLVKNWKLTTDRAKELMQEYDPDLQDYFQENWEPAVTASGMATHLL